MLEQRGMAIKEYHQPAKDGTPRCGRIKKEMKILSPSDWGKSKDAIVGVEVDTWHKTIEVRFLKGSMPLARNLFLALLADRDVRRLIEEYQQSTRKERYKIWCSSGISGRKDIFMTFGEVVGGFATTRTIKLCHISGFDRLNEGFGNEESQMYIGDFVELIAFMGLYEDMNVHSLRRRAGVKYIRPRFAEEIYDFDTTVSKIL